MEKRSLSIIICSSWISKHSIYSSAFQTCKSWCKQEEPYELRLHNSHLLKSTKKTKCNTLKSPVLIKLFRKSIDVNSTFHYILMCGGFLHVYNESHLSITIVHSLQWLGLRPLWNWIGIMAISSSLCVPVSAEAIDLMDTFIEKKGLKSQTQLGKTLSEIQHGVTSWFTVWIIAETVMTHSCFNRWF